MPKRALHLLFLLLSVTLSAGAQKEVPTFEKFRSVAVEPQKVDFDQPLPFSSVHVVDRRADTSRIGYGIKRGYYIVTLEGPAAPTLQQLLTESLAGKLDKTSDQSLLIVIRHLWLKDLSFQEMYQKHLTVNYQTPVNGYSECIAKLEVYAQRDKDYIPLFRIDSIFGVEQYLKKEGKSLLTAPFIYCLQKLTRLNYTKVAASSQRLSWEQIQQFTTQTWQYPILTDTPRQRGIYLTYADFLNNKVSTRDFEVEHGDFTDELYLVEKEARRLLTNFWGYCDGGKLFIRQDRSFYELTRQGNTFGFIADTYEQQVPGNYKVPGSNPGDIMVNAGIIGLAELIGSANKPTFKPCQLNLETGKPY